ncbi:hypothetical protein AUH73_02530 [archaeon 13_1_40CM_4_53_4]|nr:MAG: hypothetical protein AUH73_02530 [archaeon 13_1_40CM_4_53_4]OLE59507.1 MAG: hypothetical protein AUG17_02220 [Crenarchaeota archaeon 13_1_20CM_2_53_14]TMI25212.1 MAG: hypothetical protein E6H24_05415 [Candidatus Bathyarchaeota archaeon]
MNIYGYTFDSTVAPIKRLPWKPPAIPSTPWIPHDPPLEANSVVLGFLPPGLQIRFYLNQSVFSSGDGMEEKPTVLMVLMCTWLFWFMFFLTIGV